MNKQALKHDKLTKPAVQGLIKRHNLFKKLNQFVLSPLVWLQAPAGYGKTSLASSYLDEYNFPCIWLKIDQADNDLLNLLSYLRYAAIKLVDEAESSLPFLGEGSLEHLKQTSHDFLAAFFDLLPPRTHIIFDSCQELDQDSIFYEIIIESLNKISNGTTMLFLSRSTVPPVFARLKTYGIMKTMNAEDFKINKNECYEILEKIHDTGLSEQISETLRRIDGWIAAVQYCMQLGGSMTCSKGEFSSDAWETLHAFFHNEVYQNLSLVQKRFVLKTSFLSSFTSEEASLLTGESQPVVYLNHLCGNGCFFAKTINNSGIPLYKIHPMFREFLLLIAFKKLERVHYKDLKAKASRVLIKKGNFHEACRLYIETHDWEGLYKLIKKNEKRILNFENDTISIATIKDLPEFVFSRYPFLSYWQGISFLNQDPVKARVSLIKAYKYFVRKKQNDFALLAWSTIIESIVEENSNLQMLDSWLKELSQLPHENLSSGIELKVIGSVFSAYKYIKPQSKELHKWKKRLVDLIYASRVDAVAIINGCRLGEYFLNRGEFEAAEKMLGYLDDNHSDDRISPLPHLHLLFYKANFALSTGQKLSCLSFIEQGLTFAKKYELQCGITRFHALAVYCGLFYADEDIVELYQGILSDDGKSIGNIVHAQAYFFAAWQSANKNNFSMAHDLLLKAQHPGKIGGDKALEGFISAAMAHVLIEFGKYKQAQYYLRRADHYAYLSGVPSINVLTSFIRAYLSIKIDDKEEAVKHLKISLILAGKGNLPFFPWQTPSLMNPLSLMALENNIEIEYFHDLIERLRLTPPASTLEYVNWHWPIKIYTLGRFELVKDKNTVNFKRKAQQKPLELLKCLIAHGGRKICKFRIANSLWPDSDGDLQHRSLATTLHRLRKLLGRHDSIIFRNGKLTINPVICWVDIWAFERLISTAESIGKESSVSYISVIMADKAFKLYKGTFLPQETGESWPIALRERLRNRFLRGIEKIGSNLVETGKDAEAAEMFQKAIEVDPVSEKFYRHLLVCYKKMDRKAEAVILYNSYCQMMKTLLQAKPSKKTTQLFYSLYPKESHRAAMHFDLQSSLENIQL